MEEYYVHTTAKSYPIRFREDFSGLTDWANEQNLAEQKLALVTDDTVGPLYQEAVKNAFLQAGVQVSVVTFPAGEAQKNLDTIARLYRFFLQERLDRRSYVAALGGGVCGDMAGFAAATYLRGIPFLQIPTTLLSQVDSSVGGKTGVDLEDAKNIVGAFYQPELVYINLRVLTTLPKREFGAGMAEVLKYGYILSASFYDFLQENRQQIQNREPETLRRMIRTCCELKAQVVAEDEKEGGLREILNFGHTIGHAVETKLGFRLLHGECVGLGMLAALAIGIRRGELSEEVLVQARDFLQAFGLPVRAEGLSAEAVYELLFLDKKVRQSKLHFVLLEKLGQAYRTDDLTKEEILEGIVSIL